MQAIAYGCGRLRLQRTGGRTRWPWSCRRPCAAMYRRSSAWHEGRRVDSPLAEDSDASHCVTRMRVAALGGVVDAEGIARGGLVFFSIWRS